MKLFQIPLIQQDKLLFVAPRRAVEMSCLLMSAVTLCFGCTPDNRAFPHNINGITARFEIETPTVHFGQQLRVTASYRNETSHSVVFRFLPAIYDAKVLYNGVEELPCSYPEMPFTEVTLQAGQEITVKDEMPFSAECHQSGPHEIRFSYHASLLGDSKLAEMYLRKYPMTDRAIAWEDRGHKFAITK